jgi:glycerate 2-kinase
LTDVLGRAPIPSTLARPIHLIAAGKAAAAMATTLMATLDTVRSAFAAGPLRPSDLPSRLEWCQAGHPVSDDGSLEAGRRALQIASQVGPEDVLLLLLSGGASALMMVPAEGISFADKRDTIDAVMRGGADIHALNTVRKHLSQLKGGLLAAKCKGHTLTLAISDVVGDELTVIGSGPGVADPSSWLDARTALERYGGPSVPASVWDRVDRGVAGELSDTPKPGDPRLDSAAGFVIGGVQRAIESAAVAAEQLGYHVVFAHDRVVGESRLAALEWWEKAEPHLSTRPLCLLSAGETTVTVRGHGRGGRNQEFALALAARLERYPEVIAASVGTDGIDGPTDAAGAAVDSTTCARAARFHLLIEDYLRNNNAYEFFHVLDDLIITGPTGTNVGDVQILLAK